MSKRIVVAVSGLAILGIAFGQGTGFDAKKATEILELIGPDSPILDMVFSADGKRLVVAADDPVGRVWDVSNGRVSMQLTGHQNGISGVTYNTDNKTLITLGSDGYLKTWDAVSGKANSSYNLKCNGSHGDVVALKDNRVVAACAGLKMVALQNGKIMGSFKNAPLVYKLALSPDQQTVFGSVGYPEFTMWDTKSFDSFRQLKGHASQGFAVSYSADGKFVATGASDNTARIWNAATGKEIRVLKGHDNSVADVAFSPNSKILATASADLTVKLWDVATGEEIITLEGHKEYIRQLAWSKDGKFLASGDEGGIIKLWGN